MVDIQATTTPLHVGDAEAVYLVVRDGAEVLGTTVVRCRDQTCSAALLNHHLLPFRRQSHALGLRRRFGPTPTASTAPQPTASIVVCTRDRAESLQRCLTSLAGLNGSSHEIIVVDNGNGQDGTAEVVAGFDVRYVYESIPGLDRARNRGLAEATGDIVLYTDDDVEVDPLWATQLQRGFADPLVTAVTGLVLPAALDNPGQIEFEQYAGFVRTTTPFVLDGTVDEPTAAGRAGAGASMAFRRDYLLSIAGFPEELDGGQPTQTGGDTYALYRVLRDGLRVRFEPRALAFHHHRENRELARKAVAGYGTGTISYFAHGLVKERDPAAASAAAKWAAGRTMKLVRSGLRDGSSINTGYLAAECKGMLHAPAAYMKARRDVASRPTILQGGPAWDPTVVLGAKAIGHDREQTDHQRPGPRQTDIPLTVVIPTAGHRESLQRTLAAVQRQRYDHARLEIVVADDSPAGSATADLDHGDTIDVRTVKTWGAGAGAARNAAAAAASGEVLVFWDDDIEPILDTHLAAVAQAVSNGADAVLGPIVPVANPSDGVIELAVRNWWIDQANALTHKGVQSFTDICTGNLAVVRPVFAKLGGFQPLPRREDWEFGVRLLRSGASVTATAEASVRHHDHPTAAGGMRRRWLEGQGDVAFARLHPELLNSTALGRWYDFSPRQMGRIRLLLAHPERALQTASVVARSVQTMAGSGSRTRIRGQMSRMNDLAYWGGVGHATGGLDGWFELLSAVTEAVAAESPPVLELNEAAQWSPPLLPTSQVAVHHGGRFLGLAPLRWGGTPWDRDQFADYLVNRFGARTVRLEADRLVGG